MILWALFLRSAKFMLSAGIYGGFLLGVRSVNGLAFYDWENTELIRRIEIQPKHVSFILDNTLQVSFTIYISLEQKKFFSNCC